MTMNLVVHRSDANVWERAGRMSNWDMERWLVGAVACTCLLAGLRHRSLSGFLLTVGGSALAWWSAAGLDERRVHRGRVRAAMPSRSVNQDLIGEASEE